MSIEKVLWLDFETTGIDPEKDVVLEVCADVVAPNMTVLDSLEQVFAFGPEMWPLMTLEVQRQHEKSGLLGECDPFCHDHAEIPMPERLDDILHDFVAKYWPKGGCILAGNSIHFDRSFVKVKCPKTEALLHYRMIDVSAIREAIRIFGRPHRAAQDNQESREELRRLLAKIV